MNSPDLISETDAAALAGVSTTTLSRFAEAGYLQVEHGGDGAALFSKSQLAEVFGLRDPVVVVDIKLASAARATQREPEPRVETPQPEPVIYSAEVLENTPPVEEPKIEPVQVTPPEPPPSPAPVAAAEITQATLEGEITKLRNVVALQEKLLDLRDGQLKDLQEQRKWLQQRVERLEEKSDRDQLLLLSETQVLRQLLTRDQKKSSPFRAALEWFGLVDPAPQGFAGNTIEMPRRNSQE